MQNEENISNVDYQNMVKNDVCCVICREILEDPVCCEQCSGLICNSHIPQLNSCPHCRNKSNFNGDNKTIMKFLDKLEFKCNKCNNSQYQSNYKKHIEECGKEICGQCEKKMNSSDFQKHFKECEKKFKEVWNQEVCGQCEKKMNSSDFNKHKEECEKKFKEKWDQELCGYCEHIFTTKDSFQKHFKECENKFEKQWIEGQVKEQDYQSQNKIVEE